jgi:hypothetical protein
MTATTKLVNGERVKLSTEEAAGIEAEWTADDLAKQQEAERRAALQYREDRKQAYINDLGVEADLTNTLGDVLDILIKKIRAMDAANPSPHAEFDAMVAAIDRIKTENPKPTL